MWRRRNACRRGGAAVIRPWGRAVCANICSSSVIFRTAFAIKMPTRSKSSIGAVFEALLLQTPRQMVFCIIGQDSIRAAVIGLLLLAIRSARPALADGVRVGGA